MCSRLLGIVHLDFGAGATGCLFWLRFRRGHDRLSGWNDRWRWFLGPCCSYREIFHHLLSHANHNDPRWKEVWLCQVWLILSLLYSFEVCLWACLGIRPMGRSFYSNGGVCLSRPCFRRWESFHLCALLECRGSIKALRGMNGLHGWIKSSLNWWGICRIESWLLWFVWVGGKWGRIFLEDIGGFR